jgi:hypothetical protein
MLVHPFRGVPVYFLPFRRSGRFAAVSSLPPSPPPSISFLRKRAGAGMGVRYPFPRCMIGVAIGDSCNWRKRASGREFSRRLRERKSGVVRVPRVIAIYFVRFRARAIASPGVITVEYRRSRNFIAGLLC